MKTKTLILLIILIIGHFSFSQNIQKGKIVKDRQYLIDKKEITANDKHGNFVAIRPHGNGMNMRNYHVEFFENLNFTERIKIETNNETEILDVFILKEKAHVFIKERDGKTISLRLDVIDLKTKVFSQKILLKTDKNSDKPVFKALKDSYFIELNISSNLVLNFPVIEDKLTFVYVKVFSQDLKDMTQINVFADEAISNRHTEFLNAQFVNNKLYALFQLKDINNNKKRFYRLIERSQDGEQFIDIEIPVDSYELINSKIKDNHIIIAGLYSHFKNGGYQGFTYYKINLETLELESQHQSEFQNEKAQNYFTGFFKGNRDIDINNIFIDDDSNVYVVGQFYKLIQQNTTVGFSTGSFGVGGNSFFVTVNPSYSSTKVFDDILIGKINTDGIIMWDNVLALRQTEKIISKSNKRDSSTFAFFDKNEINIFMNGYISPDTDNLIVKQNKRLSKTNFYKISVNQHGGITPTIIFPNADSEIIFKAESSIKSDSIIHILGQGNMRKQLLKLEF